MLRRTRTANWAQGSCICSRIICDILCDYCLSYIIFVILYMSLCCISYTVNCISFFNSLSFVSCFIFISILDWSWGFKLRFACVMCRSVVQSQNRGFDIERELFILKDKVKLWISYDFQFYLFLRNRCVVVKVEDRLGLVALAWTFLVTDIALFFLSFLFCSERLANGPHHFPRHSPSSE